ncbi:MAG: Elongation factor Ts [Candidatus Nomurabacteria bacterium GW2011_GWF2_35_66]|uniref:Elongation factor Ts n=1 Tax=Candidatus Nomurabacteria bacterium GW2011_GWE1_35_16 TaxID=1618761 RepID=A0A0G0EG63_9BACT|nr:MAG: Elongation factor Ts [Candidatus Nomurabacteria bacterium GW2011_GWF1_34_20]KKP63141.1 MAG: Elongation factor Ts [Candidatus Nomurabacteria bacterium GW2011_GWE2_34_25]KKP66332.1 MAG: Elongation factor Ts [Candidatus Nomurabacteria bacterium GW2011_GWE1_35_16]KKP83227.1 MAG: Elongation factor Ts [Candidatus Nomurabacteria bacterium GW2011_GWF2_35_66]HAE36322.1 translation elongation factor Ts [Candidatus Nomurabacteria bacterium]
MSIKITAELVKELRDSTGVSVMQCKNALEEAEGDMEKALIILKKKSSSIAMKKSDRTAHDGIIVVVEDTGKALLLTLHSETDFVARNADFIALANELAQLAWSEGVETMQIKSLDMINPVVQKVGEKIELGKVELVEGTTIGSYVHGTKRAVIVTLTGGTTELAKDIAMHIAAMKPAFIKTDDITEEDKAKVIEVFEKEVAESDKPEDIKKKMLDGKISTYFKEQTLMEQAFIKNPELTVGNLLKEKGATFVSFIHEVIG